MTPVLGLAPGDVVRHLGRDRIVAAVQHHDADGLSFVRFEDGHWPLHCSPDTLVERRP